MRSVHRIYTARVRLYVQTSCKIRATTKMIIVVCKFLRSPPNTIISSLPSGPTKVRTQPSEVNQSERSADRLLPFLHRANHRSTPSISCSVRTTLQWHGPNQSRASRRGEDPLWINVITPRSSRIIAVGVEQRPSCLEETLSRRIETYFILFWPLLLIYTTGCVLHGGTNLLPSTGSTGYCSASN